MLAYHNDPVLRAATIAQMQAHADADQIVQGTYWDGADAGRGCAVGCLTHNSQGGHAEYPVRWGIPEILARLEDRIFEGLPEDEAKAWPLRFLNAIPCGADLRMVWPRFAVAILTDPEHGVARLTREGSPQRIAVERVAELYRLTIAGAIVSQEAWVEAAYAGGGVAGYAAAAYACAAYACAAAADATYDCADAAAADAAYDCADAAADAAAGVCARQQHYHWMAKTLLTHLASP